MWVRYLVYGIEGRLWTGLGTVLVLISTYTDMADCNGIVEKTAYCVASLTDYPPPDNIRIMKERKEGEWLVNTE